jgi:hypothetical protein
MAILESLYELKKKEKYNSKLGWKIGRGFGREMKFGETCGAIIGAIIATGLYLNDSYKNISNFVKELLTSFELEFGSIKCKGLIDSEKCKEYVAFTASSMVDILERL